LLNDLLAIEVALTTAGVPLVGRHPDVKDVPSRDVLRVRLRSDGTLDEVEVLAPEQASALWTLRDGQHNSFPFHQVKQPLLKIEPPASLPDLRARRVDDGERWRMLRTAMGTASFNETAFAAWPGDGFRRRLRERRTQLAALSDGPAAAALASIDRFLRATEHAGADLLRDVSERLRQSLASGTQGGSVFVLFTVLLEQGGGLYIDVAEDDFDRDAGSPANAAAVSAALSAPAAGGRGGLCAITGATGPLIDGVFPQPTIPVIGQTFLFSKNPDAATTARYNRTGSAAVAVGSDTAAALRAGLEELTREEWKDRTWRSIPGERPKQVDLFMAFVEGGENSSIPALLAENPDMDTDVGGAALLPSLAERLTNAFKGKDTGGRPARLNLIVLRKLDPANRKVAYSASVEPEVILAAAARWSDGCRNVPPVRLPIPSKDRKLVLRGPREIAPLALIDLTKQQFIRGGTERQEVVGLNAHEAMRLFLARGAAAAGPASSLLRRILRQRAILVERTAHAAVRGMEALKDYDRRATLDTITILGLLLHKLARNREEYMEDPAFKLGQLLAAADMLHLGYNADQRAGSAVPQLMGNAAFAMARVDPVQALSVLSSRSIVYLSWAKRNAHKRLPAQYAGKKRAEIDKANQTEFDRHWEVQRGLWASRRVAEIAGQLSGRLRPRKEVDDAFRAELLLGYVAGLPRTEADASASTSTENEARGD
jgi:hypothetical protein